MNRSVLYWEMKKENKKLDIEKIIINNQEKLDMKYVIPAVIIVVKKLI